VDDLRDVLPTLTFGTARASLDRSSDYLLHSVLPRQITVIPTASLTAWVSILYLGIFGSAVGFSWYYDGLRQLGPARAGVFINLVPVFAILLAALMLNEIPSPALLLGGLLVILGVILTNR